MRAARSGPEEDEAMDYTAIYRAARSEGLSASDACRRLIKAGMAFQDAVDLHWQIETGGAAPDFKNDHRARRAWDRGYERRHHGE
jgi:hypothetical protein